MIRLVWGQGAARTAKAAFDTALSDAGLHQYNLRELSSVIPADVELTVEESAPDLGPAGSALDVVMARQTSQPGARAAAGLAWTRADDGAGVFYEVGNHDPETVSELLRVGMERGCELRDLDYDSVKTKVITADPASDSYTCAVVIAVYGDGKNLL